MLHISKNYVLATVQTHVFGKIGDPLPMELKHVGVNTNGMISRRPFPADVLTTLLIFSDTAPTSAITATKPAQYSWRIVRRAEVSPVLRPYQLITGDVPAMENSTIYVAVQAYIFVRQGL